MVNFNKLISPRSRQHLDALHEDLTQAAGRDDKGLAHWLIGLARDMQDCGSFKTEQTYSYDEWALYRIIPELAKRLDPQIELRATEIPDESERRDRVTWVTDATTERLREMVDSIASYGSFARGRDVEAGPAANRAAEMFYYFTGDRHPMRLAMARLDPTLELSAPAERNREPLPGSYVIGTNAKRDMVLAYCDEPDEATKIFDVALLVRNGADIDEDDDRLAKSRILRFVGRETVESFTSISIQDWDGNLLREAQFTVGKDADPEPDL